MLKFETCVAAAHKTQVVGEFSCLNACCLYILKPSFADLLLLVDLNFCTLQRRSCLD